MAHNHNQAHNHEVMNYNHDKEGTKHQTEQNQLTTKENTTYYNQNNSQCVNLQYSRQNNQPYDNRYMVQPTNNYQYSAQQKYEHPYAIKQPNINHYQQQQQNYANQYLGPSGYNQQHTQPKHKNQQCINQQLANQQYMNPQHMNQQYTNQQHIIQQIAHQTQPNQQNNCNKPPEGENCNTNEDQKKNAECQKQPTKKSELKSITCTKKIRLIKSKPKTERSKIRIIKTKSRICKCKCKPCTCKYKVCTCKCKPCKCKRITCKCKTMPCKCKPSTSKCKPCVCKVKPCKCNKIKIKTCPPCSKKVENDKPCTDQNENKEKLQFEICAFSELDTDKKEDKYDISENSKVQIDCPAEKIELDKDTFSNSKDNNDKQKQYEHNQHTCYCEFHSKDIVKESNMLTKLDGKSTPEPGNKSHGILKQNTEYDHQDEDSRLSMPKKHSNAHPNRQYSHNFICECHSKGMKTSQNKTIKHENNKNQEQRFNSKYQNDHHMDQYQATIQRKNTLPHYHIDKNRVLLPKNNYTHKKIDRHLYELHTHDFSKKQNEMLINQAKVSGKSEASYQENQQLNSNYHQADISKIELTQQDQESQNCMEGNPKDIHVRLNEIKNQDKIHGLDEDQNKLGGENNKGETGGDSTLKSFKIKSSKLQYLQQKRRDMMQDSMSFCSVM